MQVPVRLFRQWTNVMCKDAVEKQKKKLDWDLEVILQSDPALMASVKAPVQQADLIGFSKTARTVEEGIQALIRPCLNAWYNQHSLILIQSTLERSLVFYWRF